jgi:hypothetical protein
MISDIMIWDSQLESEMMCKDLRAAFCGCLKAATFECYSELLNIINTFFYDGVKSLIKERITSRLCSLEIMLPESRS